MASSLARSALLPVRDADNSMLALIFGRKPVSNSIEIAKTKGPFRVLMIAPTSFFADYGCHVRILEEARILQKLGQRVTIVTYYNGQSVPGMDIRRTLPIPWRRNVEVGSSRHKIAFDALLGVKVTELLARERFDVIHAHLHEGALIALVLGRLFKLPVVFDFQGSMTAEMLDHHFLHPRSRLYKWFLGLERWIDHQMPVILTSSAHAKTILVNEFGCLEERIRVLPDCVDADSFKASWEWSSDELALLRRDLGIPAGRKLIVYLGLLAEYQGTGLLLKAMRRLVQKRTDVHLLLMGYPNEEFYRHQAEQLGISSFVTFTGRVSYSLAPKYLALGDIAVAPKLSATEGAGKLLNYMAVGLPTVAFNTPVAREYLGQDGLFARVGDVEDLADCLYAGLFPPSHMIESYKLMGRRLRQRAIRYFNWEAAGSQIIETYQELTQAQWRVGLNPKSWFDS